MRGEHHPTFRSFFSLSPLFPARSFDPSVSAFLSQLFNLKVKEAFFAKAGKRRKRHAETTEPSGKYGPTGRKGWGSAEVKEATQWKRRRSLLRAPVPVLPHAAIGSVNPARRALLSASR